MSAIPQPSPKVSTPCIPVQWSLADLQQHLGEIPPNRVRLSPPLGCATEADVLRVAEQEGRYCELDYGVLVEKSMGWYESILAILIAARMLEFVERHHLGHVLGESGSLKIMPGVVKIPDVSFVSWERFPKHPLPRRPIPALVPDLAIEILSETNTASEMDRKRERYFESGVRMVWYIDPATRTATSYIRPDQPVAISAEGFLDGGEVLPGFRISLAELFARADQRGPDSPKA